VSKVLLMPFDMLARTCQEIDLRAAQRIPCLGEHIARATVEAQFRPIAFVVRDISVKGIGLVGEHPVEPGTQIAILWDFGDPTSWRTLRARVARLTPRRGGGWVVGCEFAQPLSAEELEEFVQFDHYAADEVPEEQ
jgi:hypothetical protein